MSSLYENRKYLIDPRNLFGPRLKTTIMFDNGKWIEGHNNVIEGLRSSILDKAKELGGRNLKFRDFRDAFRLYGPNYGDVVRQVMRELESQGKVIITNIGKGNRNEYRYDII